MVNKKRLIILALIVILALLALNIRSGNIDISQITGRPSEFEVLTPEEASLTGVEEDESNLFHSPRAASDEGIYYQLSAPTSEQSEAEITKIRSRIPIYADGIKTSVGIETSYSMYVLSSGRQDFLTIHIGGVNFHESEASDANPQYVAFKETLQRAKTELERLNVDTTKLLISFGTRLYEIETAGNWARTSGIF